MFRLTRSHSFVRPVMATLYPVTLTRLWHPTYLTKRWDHLHSRSAETIISKFEQAAINADHKTMHALIDARPHGPFDQFLYWAAKHRRVSIVNRILKRDIATDPNFGLTGACEAGDPGMVSQLIGRGATDWNCGLLGAARHGHFAIARLMIDLGATNLDIARQIACDGGHHDVIDLLISRGAKLCARCRGD